jgi:hypothetical protein
VQEIPILENGIRRMAFSWSIDGGATRPDVCQENLGASADRV